MIISFFLFIAYCSYSYTLPSCFASSCPIIETLKCRRAILQQHQPPCKSVTFVNSRRICRISDQEDCWKFKNRAHLQPFSYSFKEKDSSMKSTVPAVCHIPLLCFPLGRSRYECVPTEVIVRDYPFTENATLIWTTTANNTIANTGNVMDLVIEKSLSLYSLDDQSSFNCSYTTADRLLSCENGGTPIPSSDCHCLPGFVGVRCEAVRDCFKANDFGMNVNFAVITVLPVNERVPFKVKCKRYNLSGGRVQMAYMLAETTKDYFVNFNRSWDEYENGFGVFENGLPRSNHWVGLKNAHALMRETSTKPRRLDFIMFAGKAFSPVYKNFFIEGPETNYRLSPSLTYGSCYVNNTGNCFNKKIEGPDHFLWPENRSMLGQPFSTFDRNNAGGATNCAQTFGVGWWFNTDCSSQNILGTHPWNLSSKPTSGHWPTGPSVLDIKSVRIMYYDILMP